MIARQALYGPNELDAPLPKPLWRKVLKELDDPLVKVLLAAALVDALLNVTRGAGDGGLLTVRAAQFSSTRVGEKPRRRRVGLARVSVPQSTPADQARVAPTLPSATDSRANTRRICWSRR